MNWTFKKPIYLLFYMKTYSCRIRKNSIFFMCATVCRVGRRNDSWHQRAALAASASVMTAPRSRLGRLRSPIAVSRQLCECMCGCHRHCTDYGCLWVVAQVLKVQNRTALRICWCWSSHVFVTCHTVCQFAVFMLIFTCFILFEVMLASSVCNMFYSTMIFLHIALVYT